MEEIIGVFGINGKLLVIQAINFGILLLVLWYFLYRPVLRMLEARREKIAQGVKDAETARIGREKLEGEKSAIIAAATHEGEGIVDEARERARHTEEDLLKDAEKKNERVLADATDRAEELKRRALTESKTEIARVAVLMAEKILQEKTH